MSTLYANADALYQRESALWGRSATDDGGRCAVEIRVSVERAGSTDNSEIRLYPGQGQQATPGAYALWPARAETRTNTLTAPRRQPGTQFQLPRVQEQVLGVRLIPMTATKAPADANPPPKGGVE